MGLAAGWVLRSAAHREAPRYPRCLAGAVCGCIAYYVLYFFKCFAYDGLLVEGLPPAVAVGILPLKVPASLFNAAVAILIAPPLCLVIRAALKRAHLKIA